MSEVIDAIKGHHRELMAHIVDGTESLAKGEVAQLDAYVQFLKSDLLPHAGGEEAHLYPAIDPLVRDHGHATATMSVDHEFISGYVQELEQAGNELQRAVAADRPELARRVARLAIGLEALMKVHLEKEERVYLPLFERYLPASDQQRILDGLHEAYDAQAEPAVEKILDVRRVMPAQRPEDFADRGRDRHRNRAPALADEDGGAVEHVDTAHMHEPAIAPNELDNTQSDWIWTTWRPRREHTVRTDDRAFVALDAGRDVPHRNFQRDVPLFPLRRPGRVGTVCRHGAHGERVTEPGHNRRRYFLDEIRRAVGNNGRQLDPGRRRCGSGRFSSSFSNAEPRSGSYLSA